MNGSSVREARYAVALMQKRWLVILLIVLNAVVLLGQLWPEGAPPFARTVNVAFLVVNLGFLIAAVRGRR